MRETFQLNFSRIINLKKNEYLRQKRKHLHKVAILKITIHEPTLNQIKLLISNSHM